MSQSFKKKFEGPTIHENWGATHQILMLVLWGWAYTIDNCNMFTNMERLPLTFDPHVFYNSNIIEILHYNQQWVVITYEVIYIVQAAHR